MHAQLKRDLVLGLVCFVFIILFFIFTPLESSPEPVWGARGYGLTGRTFPLFGGTLFFLANIAFLISIFYRKKAIEKGITELDENLKKEKDEEETEGITKKELLILCAVTVGALIYIQLMKVIGFGFSSMLAIAALSWFLGNRIWWSILIVTLLFIFGVSFVFGNFLNVPLPRGFLGF